MIRGVYRDGVIYPAEPVPSDWTEGESVFIEPDHREPSDDPKDIDNWVALWRKVGPIHYEPGERERIQAAFRPEGDDRA